MKNQDKSSGIIDSLVDDDDDEGEDDDVDVGLDVVTTTPSTTTARAAIVSVPLKQKPVIVPSIFKRANKTTDPIDSDAPPPMKKRRVARSVSFSSESPSCFYPQSVTPDEDTSSEGDEADANDNNTALNNNIDETSNDSDDSTPPVSPK